MTPSIACHPLFVSYSSYNRTVRCVTLILATVGLVCAAGKANKNVEDRLIKLNGITSRPIEPPLLFAPRSSSSIF